MYGNRRTRVPGAPAVYPFMSSGGYSPFDDLTLRAGACQRLVVPPANLKM